MSLPPSSMIFSKTNCGFKRTTKQIKTIDSGVAAGAEPSMLLLDISTGDLKAPQAGRRRIPEPSRNGASAYTFTTPLLTAMHT